VRECPHKLSGDPYYASVAEVKEVWRRIKSQKVKAFLASLDAKTASAVCQQMRQVLGELGIDNETATADASRGAVEEAKQKQAEDGDDDSDEDDSDDDDDDDDDESNNEDQSDEDDEDDNEDDGI
jgi:cobalamin biosynthesis protein CobT